MLCRNAIPLPGQIVQERVPQRRRLIAAQQRLARAARLGEPRDRLLALRAEEELDLAELIRLESARRLETLAEAEKFEWRHRLEDVELRDHDLQDGKDALQRVLRPMRLVAGQHARDVIELVQQLLEP